MIVENAPDIEVNVVLALRDRATEIAVRLPAGATLGDALEASGLAKRHPDVDMARARVGIFGKLSDRKAVLADGDRVEVYRALIANPKERRLKRAAARRKLQPK
jgi:putative ubiquitin-RnfH superfamily antitoxin RatB of RatAB toxin-antitoxin module